MLLHGIMSSIAEFYSRNLANEVIKGMGEKARNGGTLGKAPLGYVNVRGRDERGREVRTVELDQQRAPLSSPGFCGDWFIWCRWLPVVIVRGGGGRVPRRLRARRGFACR